MVNAADIVECCKSLITVVLLFRIELPNMNGSAHIKNREVDVFKLLPGVALSFAKVLEVRLQPTVKSMQNFLDSFLYPLR